MELSKYIPVWHALRKNPADLPEFVNNDVEYDPEHPQEHTDLWNELCKQAEQFLKEVSEVDIL